MNDRIAIQGYLDASVARVWQALTDHRAFGHWFKVALPAPFAPGREAVGQITHPGYEHLTWRAVVRTMEPPHCFAFDWHPYAVDPAMDYTGEPMTRVTFDLDPHDGGTLLRLEESGFEALPAARRETAFRMNEAGWRQQMQNLRDYLAAEGGTPP